MLRQASSLPTVLMLAHDVAARAINSVPPGQRRLAIDTTVGNGHDTAWLATCVGEHGAVLGCDVQQQAMDATRTRLQADELMHRVVLVQESHANLHIHIPEDWNGNVSAIMGNLGYLPHGDKRMTTQTDTSMAMVKRMLPYLRISGVLSLVLYKGHPGGTEEATAIAEYMHQLRSKEWRVLHVTYPNQAFGSPELVAVERLR